MGRRRYAVVGTGSRAERHIQAIGIDHGEHCELVAFADTNAVRMRVHNERLTELGHPGVPTYKADEFLAMIRRERVDVVVVATVDQFHASYIVQALEAGCDVVTEKPMTTDVTGARDVLEAVERTGRKVTVAFNYRYSPIHEKVREVLADGAIGEVGSAHFEWLLDVRHGADYFRRWHRDKANSGGLMVHKATHHFDLVNWWLGTSPETVFAQGRLFFYGRQNGERHGHARDYERVHGSAAAKDDPFALHIEQNEWQRRLYLEAESEDGYWRDQNPFAAGVSIEDDMAVLVRYVSGATMTYHLTAYSPWEGYRFMVNGSAGRLELEVVENSWVSGQRSAVHGVEANPEEHWARLTVRPFFDRPVEIELKTGEGGHGGADDRMTAALYGEPPEPDPLGRRATHRDGVMSLLTGFAANESFGTGRPVRVDDLIKL